MGFQKPQRNYVFRILLLMYIAIPSYHTQQCIIMSLVSASLLFNYVKERASFKVWFPFWIVVTYFFSNTFKFQIRVGNIYNNVQLQIIGTKFHIVHYCLWAKVLKRKTCTANTITTTTTTPLDMKYHAPYKIHGIYYNIYFIQLSHSRGLIKNLAA